MGRNHRKGDGFAQSQSTPFSNKRKHKRGKFLNCDAAAYNIILKKTSAFNSLRWSIYIFNSVVITKLCYTPQHHSLGSEKHCGSRDQETARRPKNPETLRPKDLRPKRPTEPFDLRYNF